VTADVVKILSTVGADGALEVHLAPYNWAARSDVRTLCRLQIRTCPPSIGFHKRGCLRCATRAVGMGIFGVLEPDGAVVNLARFVDARTR
jgi:hypothetical protein